MKSVSLKGIAHLIGISVQKIAVALAVQSEKDADGELKELLTTIYAENADTPLWLASAAQAAGHGRRHARGSPK